ncbi:MAG: hypothetical protein CR968_03575 [Flavobacteriia bacterium]|nr:MAG: hypothetical protein CR968_03575 [Flavobacteriia bacterium]
MNIFKKIFGLKRKIEYTPQKEAKGTPLPSEDLFVEQFKSKGGKFLYTDDAQEILVFLKNIIKENHWSSVKCFDKELLDKLNVVSIDVDQNASVFFTKCEHLLADEGSILFSSNQIKEEPLRQYPKYFIVYATTSQLIANKDHALTSIKFKYRHNLPTNISAVKDYNPGKSDPGFLNYGNTNAKDLYLLLFEDL